jgi:hypothetical protein
MNKIMKERYKSVEVGDKVIVECDKGSGKRYHSRIMKLVGKIIFKNEHFFTMMMYRGEGPCYKESFMWKDEINIQKVRR